MGSLLATVFLAVPLITWLGGLILLTDSQWKVARPPLRAARDLPKLPELQFLRSRRAFESPSGRGALDEVKR